MPRAGQTTTALGAGLPQRVVLGLLIRSFPPAQVDEILDLFGRREQRQRLLPARLMVYFTLGMWIFGALSYEEVLAEIVRGVPGLTLPAGTESATAAAIGRARRRLGVEPLRLLFEQAAERCAPSGPDPLLPGGWRTLRLSRIAVEVPDTLANRIEFAARPLEAAAAGAPRVYLSLLIDDHTHQIVAASVSGGTDWARDRLITAAMAPGAVVLMDERPFSTALWTAVRDRGAEQLWPVADEVSFPVHQRLPDGSGLSWLPGAAGPAARSVRVVDRGGPAQKNGENGSPARGRERLVTSILDHRKAPAERLGAVFDRYRTSGYGFEGISAYQGGNRIVLRSKSPDLVCQELYAMLCVHHAIGELVDATMYDANKAPRVAEEAK
jgi:hypothetical protein